MRSIALPGLIFFFIVVVTGLEITNPSYFWECCAQEDALLEHLTALSYFIAAGMCLYQIRKYGWLPLWLICYAAMFIVVGGEEISWGQRILGITTPENLREINVQDEFNLHNIEGIHDKIRLIGTLIVCTLCILLPVAQRFVPTLRSLIAKFRFPVYPFRHIYIALVAIAFMAIPRVFLGGHNDAMDEVGEFVLSFAFLVFAVCLWRGTLTDTPRTTASTVS